MSQIGLVVLVVVNLGLGFGDLAELTEALLGGFTGLANHTGLFFRLTFLRSFSPCQLLVILGGRGRRRTPQTGETRSIQCRGFNHGHGLGASVGRAVGHDDYSGIVVSREIHFAENGSTALQTQTLNGGRNSHLGTGCTLGAFHPREDRGCSRVAA